VSAVQLVETAVDLVQAHLKSGISSALGDVRTLRTDAKVTTEPPHTTSWFIYERPMAYKCPAVLLIARETDFQEDTEKPNHINAVHDLAVAVVVEDKDQERLVRKSWRYQSALYKLLHRARLTTGDGAVSLTVIVRRATFSPEFTDSGKEGDPQGVFRKEVLFTCQVRHREND